MVAEDEILIYGENSMDTRFFILQGGNRYYTELKKILESLKRSIKNYNLILSDFELVSPDSELEKYLNSRYSIFYRGDELDGLVK